MIDPRMKKLADLLVGYSTTVQPGERVYIVGSEVPAEMIELLIERVTEAGGLPFVDLPQARVTRALYKNATKEQMELLMKRDLEFMKEMNCFISIRGGQSNTELADVPKSQLDLVDTFYGKPVRDQRVNHTKWCGLRWPTPSMAQQAGMSTEAFEDFYFDVCTLDYAKMAEAEKPLVELMERTDKVRMVGPMDTDIAFSVKGIGANPCMGTRNIPDGEVYTAPIRDSVNGVIHFNCPTIHQGKPHDDIRLVFKDGKIVEATSTDTKSLNEALDVDEGARYIGEFSIGVNPHIKRPMRDILFDEKITGSIHFTPGQAYKVAYNGNDSKIHWDMVMIQTPEYGGGEIYFDDELIRKDGRFVPDFLQVLNPENLV